MKKQLDIKDSKTNFNEINDYFIQLIGNIRNNPSLSARKKLLKEARAVHLQLLKEINHHKITNRLEQAIHNHSLVVKAISADINDPKNNIEFFARRIIFSETDRKVQDKEPENKLIPADRSTIFDTVTLKIETREINPTSCEEQETPFAKRTPFTLAISPSRTHTFNIYQYSVLLLGDLRHFYLKNRHIFNRNMVTNLGWHVKGNKGWTEATKDEESKESHKASPLHEIQDTQYENFTKNTDISNISKKIMSAQNELVCRPSFAGCLGFAAVAKKCIDEVKKIYQYLVPARADRLNALYANYVFRQVAYERAEYKTLTYLLQNIPCYILNPESDHLIDYTISQQLNDLEDALDDKHSTPYSTKIVEKLRQDVKTLEIYSPAIKLFFLLKEYQQDQNDSLRQAILNPENILTAFREGFPWQKLLPEQRQVLFESKEVSADFMDEILNNNNQEVINYLAEDDKIVLANEHWRHPKLWPYALKNLNKNLITRILTLFPDKITEALDTNSDEV